MTCAVACWFKSNGSRCRCARNLAKPSQFKKCRAVSLRNPTPGVVVAESLQHHSLNGNDTGNPVCRHNQHHRYIIVISLFRESQHTNIMAYVTRTSTKTHQKSRCSFRKGARKRRNALIGGESSVAAMGRRKVMLAAPVLGVPWAECAGKCGGEVSIIFFGVENGKSMKMLLKWMILEVPQF